MAVGWGVLGTGSHVQDRMAPALVRASETRLAAVCSRDLARAQEMAARFGFARCYDSYEKMLRDDSVEAVYICTPNALHAQQTIDAAKAGKHVLVEKPMALTTAEAEAMLEACESHGVKLGVGFHLRHHPGQRQAREIVQRGKLGKLILVEARWVVASGRREGWWQDPDMIGAYIMMARGVHLVDLIAYLSGRDPLSVSMMTDGQRIDRPLEETAVGTMRLGDDLFAHLVATRYGTGASNGFAVYGTEGFMQGVGTVGPAGTGTLQLVTGVQSTQITYESKDPFQEEIESFNTAVLEGSPFGASGMDGLRSVRVTEALLESARTGRTVEVKPTGV